MFQAEAKTEKKNEQWDSETESSRRSNGETERQLVPSRSKEAEEERESTVGFRDWK